MPGITVRILELIPDSTNTIGRLSVTVRQTGDNATIEAPLCSPVEGTWDKDPVVMHSTEEDGETEFQMAVFFPKSTSRYDLVVSDRDNPDIQAPVHFPSHMADDYLLGISNANNPRYPRWLKAHENDAASMASRYQASSNQPLFFIALNESGSESELASTVSSMVKQHYKGWLLLLPKGAPSETVVAAFPNEPRLLVCESDTQMAAFFSKTLDGQAATREYVGFLEPGSVLHPLALTCFAQAFEEKPLAKAAYCDSDHVDKKGRPTRPLFKPDFNLDLLRSRPYTDELFVAEKGLLEEYDPRLFNAGPARKYDLSLVASENTEEIIHLPFVLCHTRERQEECDGVRNELSLALRRHLDRTSPKSTLEAGLTPDSFFVTYPVVGEPMVSVIIPSKDQAELLSNCIESVFARAGYDNIEVIVVENNSTQEQTFALYHELELKYKDRFHLVVHETDGSFNYSALINHGVRESRGEYILTLNNDTVAKTDDFLKKLLGQCQRHEVGAVGARLLFPDGTIQHAGVAVSLVSPDEYPGMHLMHNTPEGNPGYESNAVITQDYCVVTGACQMFPRCVFDEVGGYEEQLAVAFNDVDFCLKVREAGYLVVYDASVMLFHLESVSRGFDCDSEEKIARAKRESNWMYARWAETYRDGDPYFNKNLDPRNPYFKTIYPHDIKWLATGIGIRLKRMASKALDRFV